MGAQVRIVPEALKRLFHQPVADLHTNLRRPCWYAPRRRQRHWCQPDWTGGVFEHPARCCLALYASIIAIESQRSLISHSICWVSLFVVGYIAVISNPSSGRELIYSTGNKKTGCYPGLSPRVAVGCRNDHRAPIPGGSTAGSMQRTTVD